MSSGKPSHASDELNPLMAHARNIRLLGHSNLNGFGDGMHVNLRGKYAYVGHMGESHVGTSIVDISDPRQPRIVNQILAPNGTHSHKVQVVGDVLLVNYERNARERDTKTWMAGLKIFDLSAPETPREIAFFPTPGRGVHRMTYWEEPYAYLSASDIGFDDQFLLILDLSDPSRPREVGRWWYPGMHSGAGETPTWPSDRRYNLHHAVVCGDRAYCAWRDAGIVILDISSKSSPKMISHLDFGAAVSGTTHTACPLPGRSLLVVTDEAVHDVTEERVRDPSAEVPKDVRVVDISDERTPRVLCTFPVPEGDPPKGGRFGPHNVHEMRPGSLVDPNTVYVTYFSGGLRVLDVTDPLHPKEVAYCVPAAPRGRPCIQLNDVLVDANGIIYVTDRYAGGLYVMERTA